MAKRNGEESDFVASSSLSVCEIDDDDCVMTKSSIFNFLLLLLPYIGAATMDVGAALVEIQTLPAQNRQPKYKELTTQLVSSESIPGLKVR